MTNYLITMKPVDRFFFGGEQTFGDGENANYFAKSNLFPQQTSLLGMLRKQLLILKGYYREDASAYRDMEENERIGQLIGKRSFNADEAFNNPNVKQSFGAIKSISPVFICDVRSADQQFYIPSPKDYRLKFEKMQGKTGLNGKQLDFIPTIRFDDVEEGISNSLVSPDCESPLSFEDVFSEQVKIGININRSDTNEGEFFKQQFYRMSVRYAFAFFADLDFKLENDIVFMGADNSSFFLECHEKPDHNFAQAFDNLRDNGKITLLSDALVEKSIYDYCDFAISRTVPFRNINTETGAYYFNKNRSKSRVFNLLERGSVLLFQMSKTKKR